MNSLDFSRIQACTAGRLKSEGADLNEEMLEMVRREYPETGGGAVVGNGKGIFTGGYQIPAGTLINIIRP